jgi:hypothetical protein
MSAHGAGPVEKPTHAAPRACLRSTRLRAHCDTCGVIPVVLHSPLSLRGFFCPSHCPVCASMPGAAARQALPSDQVPDAQRSARKAKKWRQGAPEILKQCM